MKNKYIIYLIVSCLIISLFISVTTNFVSADDTTGGTIEGNTIYYENSYAKLLVYPHTSKNDIIQLQYANLTWKLANNQIDVAFRFDNALTNCDIWKLVSGNWVNIKGAFQHTIYNGKHYYYVQNFNVVKDTTYYFKWSYDVKFNSSGKWFLFAKLSSETFAQALSLNHYVCLDPWWSSSWNYYKVCTIGNKFLGSQIKLIVANNTGSNYNVSCSGHVLKGHDFKDIRFVNLANNTEYYHWMENDTINKQATFWINNSDNASAILMYYGNSNAVNTSYRNGTNTFFFYDNFDGASISTHLWAGDLVHFTCSGGIATQYHTIDCPAYSKSTWNGNLFFRSYMSASSPATATSVFGFGLNGYTQRAYRETYQTTENYLSSSGATYLGSATNWEIGSWNTIQINLIKSTSIRWYEDGVQLTGSPATTSGKIPTLATGVFTTVTKATNTIDWIVVGKLSLQYWVGFGLETINATPRALLIFVNSPVDNEREVCPCCILFNVTISSGEAESMDLTFSNNYTGDFEVISGLVNGTYSFCVDFPNTFNRFGVMYEWIVTVVTATNTTSSGWQHFITSYDVNCSDSITAYSKTESDALYLSSALSLTPEFLFLAVCLSLWLFFISKYFDNKSMMLGLCIFGISIPTSLILASISLIYPFGFVLVFIIPIVSLYLLSDGIYYEKENKKKK
jgi:hypothetical protein